MPDELFNTLPLFRPVVSGDAGAGREGGGAEGDKSHPQLRSTSQTSMAAQELQHFPNQSSEQFDGGGGGVRDTAREHEGHGLEVSFYIFFVHPSYWPFTRFCCTYFFLELPNPQTF